MYQCKFYNSKFAKLFYISICFMLAVSYPLAYVAYWMSTAELHPYIGIPLLLLGLGFFLVARFSVSIKKEFFTFWSEAAQDMTPNMKFCYALGYLLMVFGFFAGFQH